MTRHSRALPAIGVGLALVFCATLVFGLQPTDGELNKAAMIPSKIPVEARNQENPFAWNADVRKKGKLYFSSQCTMCHGADGRGQGDLVERLELQVPDFTDQSMQDQWTDGAMFYMINKGHGAMPSQKERFDDEIKWGLVNYVRSFAKPD